MKFAVIAGLLLGSLGGVSAEAADKFVNIETNAGIQDTQVGAVVTDAHVGIEGANQYGTSWYAQAGPQFVMNDGSGDGSVNLSGKVGGAVPLGGSVDLYGELSFATGSDDVAYGAKLGTKIKF
jgi:hypothetical protein|tara:strand:+ start:1486 stop:1854 length:369 start_codon:yes stop_codon:yes gene_type:complete